MCELSILHGSRVFRGRGLAPVGCAKEENVMLQTEIHDYARKLLQVRGPDAIAEAAQKAITFEKEGKAEDAKNWRHIADAMKQMRGPHQS
jgi:hypothetical protein